MPTPPDTQESLEPYPHEHEHIEHKKDEETGWVVSLPVEYRVEQDQQEPHANLQSSVAFTE